MSNNHNQHSNLQIFNPIYNPEQLSRLTTFFSHNEVIPQFTTLNQSQTNLSLFYLVINNQNHLPIASFHNNINKFLNLPPVSNNSSKTPTNNNPIINNSIINTTDNSNIPF